MSFLYGNPGEQKTEAKGTRLIDLAMPETSYEITQMDMRKLKLLAQKEVMEKVPIKYLGKYRDKEAKEVIRKQVQQVVERTYPEISKRSKTVVIENITNEISGYGILEILLNDTNVTEILIERFDKITIEKDGILQDSNLKFDSEEDLNLVVERIIMPLGRRLDIASPTVDARLPDGSRICAVIPPVAVDGTQVSIRKFKPNVTMDQLIKFGALNEKIKEALVAMVKGRMSIIVSGGTGSGKSTFLNALSSYINPQLSIITIENPCELQFDHPRVRRWEARPPNIEGKGEISMMHLLVTALRSRPDIIILGEIRGTESFTFLQAVNTGHDGSMTSMHANNSLDAMKRLVSMVASSKELTPDLVPSYIAGSIDIIVQLSRMPDGSRKLTEIAEVVGEKDGKILTKNLLEYKYEYDGKVIKGDWVTTDNTFSKADILKNKGIEFKGF